MRVAIADDGRRYRDGSLIGNAALAARFNGQNVRELSKLKLENVAQFMKEQRPLISCLMETWRLTPGGWESEEIDGFFIVDHGETTSFF